MKSYLLLLAVLAFLTSCDPGVSYERIITNNSSHDIWIKATDYTSPELVVDSFFIAKNTEQIIHAYSGLGQTSEFSNCGMPDSALYGGLIATDTLAFSINLNEVAHWEFSVLSESFKQGGECECRLTLTDAFIE